MGVGLENENIENIYSNENIKMKNRNTVILVK